jgi:hypothetical protein
MHNQKFFLLAASAQLVRFRTEAFLAPFHPILSTGIGGAVTTREEKKKNNFNLLAPRTHDTATDAKLTPA